MKRRWQQNKFSKKVLNFLLFKKFALFNLRDFLELNFVLQIWANKSVISQKESLNQNWF